MAHVQCVHKNRSWPAHLRDSIVRAKASLPFAESSYGQYTHRVRYVELHAPFGTQKRSHIAIGCWCGQVITISERKPNRLLIAPSEGRLVCATCEGRAIGSGQLGSRVIAGREVSFRPHVAAA